MCYMLYWMCTKLKLTWLIEAVLVSLLPTFKKFNAILLLLLIYLRFLVCLKYRLWYCTKKLSFSLRICSVNATKSAGNWRFGHIHWKNPSCETSVFVRCKIVANLITQKQPITAFLQKRFYYKCRKDSIINILDFIIKYKDFIINVTRDSSE